MTSFPFEDFVAVVAWLGGACFCGILPLGFAAVVFLGTRKRGQMGSAVSRARLSKAAGLQPSMGLVRLQGQIAPRTDPIDGSAGNALVYLRLKVEVYQSDSEDSGWRGLTDKARGIPFQLDDGSGTVWVDPTGLDKLLLGNAIVPDDNQVQAACILLGIPPNMLRGQLRFSLWELRAGQTLTVVGNVVQAQNGMEITRGQGQPLIITPLLGQAVDARISTQTNASRTWMLVLGIPGALFLICGLGGALVSLVRVLIRQ